MEMVCTLQRPHHSFDPLRRLLLWWDQPFARHQPLRATFVVLMQVFTYDGRQVCSIRPTGLNPEGVSRQLISLSNDTLAAAVGCSVRCYETAQGRPVGEPVTHNLEVKAVCLSQVCACREKALCKGWQNLIDIAGSSYRSIDRIAASMQGPGIACGRGGLVLA